MSLTAFWIAWRDPVIAAAVTVAALAAARLLALPALAGASAGLGLAAGWGALNGTLIAAAAPGRLTVAALIAAAAQLLAGRARLAALAGLTVALAWWFSGPPRTLPALRHDAPILIAIAALVAVQARLLAGRAGWDAAAGGLAVALAAWLLHLPHFWLLAGAVLVAAAAVAALARVAQELALAGGLAALQVALVLGAGRLPALRLAPADLMAIGALLAAWLARRIEPRFGAVGAAAGALAAGTGGAITAGLAFFVAHLLPR